MRSVSYDDLRVSLFAPIDRETPIVEVLLDEEPLFDLSYQDDDPGSDVVVLFHDKASGIVLPNSDLSKIIEKGICRLREG